MCPITYINLVVKTLCTFGFNEAGVNVDGPLMMERRKLCAMLEILDQLLRFLLKILKQFNHILFFSDLVLLYASIFHVIV